MSWSTNLPPDLPEEALMAAELKSNALKHFYIEGGGSEKDFITDLAQAVVAALRAVRR